jgi:hypothetical protein
LTFATDPPTITLLGDDTLIGNLRVQRAQSSSPYYVRIRPDFTYLVACGVTIKQSASEVARLDPLIKGDKVSVVTRGGSNLIKTFEVTQYAPRDERQDGMHGTTHVYGRGAINVDQGFAANIMKARAIVSTNLILADVEIILNRQTLTYCMRCAQINSSTAAAASPSKKDDDSDDDW